MGAGNQRDAVGWAAQQQPRPGRNVDVLAQVDHGLHLEASGYQVTVTELVGWEHSLKNELILARHTGHKKHSARERLAAILEEFGLTQALGPRFGVQTLLGSDSN